MNPTKKNRARVKARVMHEHFPKGYKPGTVVHFFYSKKFYGEPLPVSVLPRDPASEAAMIEQGAKALFERCVAPWSRAGKTHKIYYRQYARAVLASLGLLEGHP